MKLVTYGTSDVIEGAARCAAFVEIAGADALAEHLVASASRHFQVGAIGGWLFGSEQIVKAGPLGRQEAVFVFEFPADQGDCVGGDAGVEGAGAFEVRDEIAEEGFDG